MFAGILFESPHCEAHELNFACRQCRGRHAKWKFPMEPLRPSFYLELFDVTDIIRRSNCPQRQHAADFCAYRPFSNETNRYLHVWNVGNHRIQPFTAWTATHRRLWRATRLLGSVSDFDMIMDIGFDNTPNATRRGPGLG